MGNPLPDPPVMPREPDTATRHAVEAAAAHLADAAYWRSVAEGYARELARLDSVLTPKQKAKLDG